MSSASKSLSLPLGDLLPRFPSIQIFASLTRDVSTVSALLSSNDGGKGYSIILAPTNSALRSLSHKPWESSLDYKELGAEAYSGEQGEKRADNNLRKFVEQHVVVLKEGSLWEEGESGKVQTAGGTEVWWEKSGDQKVLKPDDVKVKQILEKGANGEVWEIDGVLGAL